MSKIIGPPKDVALFNAAILIKELFAVIDKNPGPIPHGLRKKASAMQNEIMEAIMSDAIRLPIIGREDA